MIPATDVDRLPPHNVEAEEAVLGSLLIDDEAIHKVAPVLEPSDFFREKHLWTYQACLALRDRNEPINLVSVAYELATANRLEPVGGAAWLTHLMAQVPSSVYVEHFALLVKRTSLQRKLLRASVDIAGLAHDAGPEVDAAIARAEEIIYGIRHAGAIRDFTPLSAIIDELWNEQHQPDLAYKDRPEFVPTGFIDLDPVLGGGLKRSDLVILAARPSIGKTSMVLNIAMHAALKGQAGKRATVAFFSLEMSKLQLAQRMLAAEANVDSQRIQLKTYSDIERDKIMDAMGRLWDARVYIDDSPILRGPDMRSKLRRLDSQVKVDLVVVDYLQLIQGTGNPNANRVAEVSDITRGLKGMARELNVPVIALSQLSRAIEQRPNHEPMLSDLRESGSIEQDADVVIFLSREDKRYTEEEWKARVQFKPGHEGEPYPRGIVDVIVAKHRNGPTGRVKLRFFENSTRFGNLERVREP